MVSADGLKNWGETQMIIKKIYIIKTRKIRHVTSRVYKRAINYSLNFVQARFVHSSMEKNIKSYNLCRLHCLILIKLYERGGTSRSQLFVHIAWFMWKLWHTMSTFHDQCSILPAIKAKECTRSHLLKNKGHIFYSLYKHGGRNRIKSINLQVVFSLLCVSCWQGALYMNYKKLRWYPVIEQRSV